MKNIYKPLEVSIIRLNDCDCIRTSDSYNEDYNDNELPLVPFE